MRRMRLQKATSYLYKYNTNNMILFSWAFHQPHEGANLPIKVLMAPSTTTGFNQKVANRVTAQVIPIVLAAIVGYITWVVVVLVGGQ